MGLLLRFDAAVPGQTCGWRHGDDRQRGRRRTWHAVDRARAVERVLIA